MLRETIRPPVFKDPIVEVFILRAIFVGGIVREAGTKITMQSSDAWALSKTIPATVEFNK